MFSKRVRTLSLQYANGEVICVPTVQNKTLIFKYNIVRILITVSQVIFPKCYCLWAKAICCRIFQYICNMFFSSVLSGPLKCRIVTLVAFPQLPSKPKDAAQDKFTQNSCEEPRVGRSHSNYVNWGAKEKRWIKFGNLEYFPSLFRYYLA